MSRRSIVGGLLLILTTALSAKTAYEHTGKVTWWTAPSDRYESVRQEAGIPFESKLLLRIEFDGKSYPFSSDDPVCSSSRSSWRCVDLVSRKPECTPVEDEFHKASGLAGPREGTEITIDFRIKAVRKDGIAEIMVPCSWTDKNGKVKRGESRYYVGN